MGGVLKLGDYLFVFMGVVFLAVALFCFWFGAKEIAKVYAISVLGIETDATVIEFKHSTSRNWKKKKRKNTYSTPVFEFIDQTGVTRKFSGEVASGKQTYNLGEKVRIKYNPKNPSQARPTNLGGMWGSVLLLFGIGLPFALFGGGILASAFVFQDDKVRDKTLATAQWKELTISRVITHTRKNRRGSTTTDQVIQIDWTNPKDGKVYTFAQEINNVPEPTKLEGQNIRVKFDPNNKPDKYYEIDLSNISGQEIED